MRSRGPRALIALLLTASAGAFGIAALSTAAAHATPTSPATGGCGANPCPPDIQVSNMAADGSVRVVYTDPYSGGLEAVDPNTLSLTVTWKPQGDIPSTLPPHPNVTSVKLTNGTCAGTGPVTCDYAFPAELKVPSGLGFALNGTYELTATGSDCRPVILGCSRTTTPSKLTTLTNAPSTPGGVTADLLAATSGVKVSWTPSPEPDVFGYRVLRNDGSVACDNVATPTVFSCTDTTSGGGTFSYRVVASRYGADYRATSQVTSAPSTASKAVTVPGPPATTTTTITGGTLPPLTQPGFAGKPGGSKPGAVVGVGGANGSFKATPGTAAAATGSDTPANGDTGFAPTLPYGQQPSTTINEDPGSIAAPVTPHQGKTSVATIAALGAGLLIAVIALHGLWLRSEVRRAGALEVLEPEA
jgi:hypothetical protein